MKKTSGEIRNFKSSQNKNPKMLKAMITVAPKSSIDKLWETKTLKNRIKGYNLLLTSKLNLNLIFFINIPLKK